MESPTKTCFIAMPVSTTPAHAEQYGDREHWLHVMESLFVPAIEAAGFEAWRPVAKGSHLIHAEIVRQLEQADMVLVDMSQSNPNVFFELGVRTSVNKPVALVRSDQAMPIPFDVSGINTHTYDPALKAWHIASEVEALSKHLRDAESSCAGENPMWRQFGLTLKANEPTSEASPTDARLEVMGRQLTEMTARMNAFAHARRTTEDAWDYSEGNEMSRSPSVDETVATIAAMGANHNIVCDVEFNLNDGFVITVLGRPQSASDLRKFRGSVKAYLGLRRHAIQDCLRLIHRMLPRAVRARVRRTALRSAPTARPGEGVESHKHQGVVVSIEPVHSHATVGQGERDLRKVRINPHIPPPVARCER